MYDNYDYLDKRDDCCHPYGCSTYHGDYDCAHYCDSDYNHFYLCLDDYFRDCYESDHNKDT